ncbi:hypothetical protein V6N13_122532 [Hibiscus sabdariffa]
MANNMPNLNAEASAIEAEHASNEEEKPLTMAPVESRTTIADRMHLSLASSSPFSVEPPTLLQLDSKRQ